MKFILIETTCPNLKEAKRIGDLALKQRLATCYDIYPIIYSRYFWPPRKNKITRGKGCLLSLVSLPDYAQKLKKMIQSRHSYLAPFISLQVANSLDEEYNNWLRVELK